MTTQYGQIVQAPYVMPHPTKRGHYVAEMRPGRVVGFSHPNLARRSWGFRGDMLVRFEDGAHVWTKIY